jgi:hypothetical protein
MKRSHVLAVVLPFLAITSSACSAEQRITCPELLHPEAVQANRPPAGWKLYMPQEVYLSGGGMVQGPPEQSGYMVPDKSKRTKSGNSSMQTDRWTFHAPEGDPVWLYCGYGGGRTPIQIFKPVPDDARECVLTTRFANDQTQELVFVCK